MPSVEESVSNMHSVYQERSAAKYKMDFAELEDIRRSVAEMHLALSKKAIRKVTTETRSTINLNSGPQANLNITVDSRSASAASLNRPRLDTVCGICSKIGYYSCSVCGKVYCSEQCQREDWPSHRSICSSSSNHVPPEQQNNSPERPTSIDRSRNNSQRSPHSPQTREVNVQPSLPKLKKQDITFGVKIQVTAIDIEDISRFFLQTDSDAAALVSIQSSLQETCNGNVPGFRPQVGDICAAKYDADGQWYRAKILTFQDNQYNIRFIDYGNSSTVSVADTCPLPTSFFELPPQAFQCKLTSLVPASGKQSEVLERLQNFLVTVPLFAKFINCIDDVYEVELYNDQGTSFVSKAVSDGIAKAQQPVSKNEGFKRENHVAPSRDSNHIPSVLSKFGPGETIEMCVTVSDKDGVWGMVISNTNIFQAAMDVEEKLNADCPTQVQNNTFRPQANQYVAARSEAYQRWFRAYVTNIIPSGVHVRYTDYGNEEDLAQVLPLPENHKDKPALAVKVSCSKQHDIQFLQQTYPAESKLSVTITEITSNGLIAELIGDKASGLSLLVSSWNSDLGIASFVETPTQKETLRRPFPSPRENVPADPRTKKAATPIKVSVSEALKKKLLSPQADAVKPTVHREIIKQQLPKGRSRVEVVWIDGSVLYLQMDSERTLLRNMMSNLNSKVQNLPAPSSVNVGDNVAALFEEDNVYYRATVLTVNGGICGVKFLDFGNCSQVPLGVLKELTPEFTKFPLFSYEVRLHGVKQIMPDVCGVLINQSFLVEVVEEGLDPALVKLYIENSDDCINDIISENI